MSPILRRFCIIAVLLVPSFYSLYRNSDVPKFCQWHDDCVYMVSAKSLTDGGGYRIMSLPGEPAQTKYPPLYPLVLSLAWHIQPNFPETLTYAAWLTWLPLPVSLWLLAAYFPRLGFEGWRMWTLLGLVALSPYTLLFTTTLLSEALFAALLVGSLLLAERAADTDSGAPLKFALVSGIVMGLAYLARSSGIAALAALPAFFYWRRRPRLAFPFLAGMIPFVAAWIIWARAHQVYTPDPMLMYYVDYVGYEVYNVPLESIPLLLWKNLDGLLGALGSLIMIKFSTSFFLKIVQVTLGIATILGLIRLAKQGKGLSFLFFFAANSLLLLVWHFPPDTRFIFPLLPLSIAGFWTEMEYRIGAFWAGLRYQQRDQRIAARALLAVTGLLLSVSLAMQAFLTFIHLPRDGEEERENRTAQEPAYEWIRNNTDPSTAVLTLIDPLFYLQTGRHAIRLSVPPKFWYRDDREATLDVYRGAASYAREKGLTYVYHPGEDFMWGVGPDDRAQIDQAIRTNPDFIEVFRETIPTIYRVQPASGHLADRTPHDSVDHASDQHNP